MADEVKPAVPATPPAGTPTGTPAATAAPVVDTSQVELQRLRTELGIERKRREDTQRMAFKAAEELKRMREGGQEPTEETVSYGGYSPEIMAATVQRAAFLNVAIENANDPTSMALLGDVQKILSDPEQAERYRRPDPADSYREVLRDLKMAAIEGANSAKDQQIADLTKQLESRSQTRGALAAQAVVSGSVASEGQSDMTMDEFRKLPRDEQRKILVAMGQAAP